MALIPSGTFTGTWYMPVTWSIVDNAVQYKTYFLILSTKYSFFHLVRCIQNHQITATAARRIIPCIIYLEIIT